MNALPFWAHERFMIDYIEREAVLVLRFLFNRGRKKLFKSNYFLLDERDARILKRWGLR